MDANILAHPAIQRLKRVARALGSLSGEVVFIGGSIAPLLQAEPPFDATRPTKDVDGIIASTTYSDLGPLHETLRTLGFRQKPGESVHLHRWWSREDDPFDLVLAGAHLGGSSQPWDRIALKNTVDVHLGDAVTIRHANAAAFLGLKWAAYIDRGASDPYGSHDLEDILGVVVSRPSIVEEIRRSDPELRAFVSAQTAALLEDNRLHDLLADT